MTGPIRRVVARWATRVRYPRLLALTVALFAVDLAVPDVIPFVDEVLLGLGAVLLARLRPRRTEPAAVPGRDDVR